MNIIPLSKSNVEQALTLLNRVFPNDVIGTNPPELGLRASLDREAHKEYLEKYNNVRLEYYVLVDDRDNMIGVTGIFSRTTYPETGWLGWFCVAPEARGKGYGSLLLNYTIDKAREYGYKNLSVYTDTDESPEALSLYQKAGFVLAGKIKDPTNPNILVTALEKKL